MSEYININEQSKEGKLLISCQVFEQLVGEVISNMAGVSLKAKSKGFALVKPVDVSIEKGIAHIRVNVELKKEINIQEFITRTQNEIANAILSATDQIPFDIQIKVESLI